MSSRMPQPSQRHFLVNVTGDDAFDDADTDDDLVYVVQAMNPKVATVSFGTNTPFADTTDGVIAAWWDSLTCRERNNALGKRGGAEAQPGAGTCRNFEDLTAETPQPLRLSKVWSPRRSCGHAHRGGDGIRREGGRTEQSGGYKKPFANLTAAQRASVANLYADADDTDGDKNILAAGAGTLTVTQVNLGSTEIVVKASDSAGRFLGEFCWHFIHCFRRHLDS